MSEESEERGGARGRGKGRLARGFEKVQDGGGLDEVALGYLLRCGEGGRLQEASFLGGLVASLGSSSCDERARTGYKKRAEVVRNRMRKIWASAEGRPRGMRGIIRREAEKNEGSGRCCSGKVGSGV
jgi:hypothetical protein